MPRCGDVQAVAVVREGQVVEVAHRVQLEREPQVLAEHGAYQGLPPLVVGRAVHDHRRPAQVVAGKGDLGRQGVAGRHRYGRRGPGDGARGQPQPIGLVAQRGKRSGVVVEQQVGLAVEEHREKRVPVVVGREREQEVDRLLEAAGKARGRRLQRNPQRGFSSR